MAKNFKKKPAFAVPRVPKQAGSTYRKYVTRAAKRKLRTKVSPERLEKLINKLIEKSVSGKSRLAADILMRLSKPLAVKTTEGMMKLVDPPIAGVAASEKQKLPLTSNINVKMISGKNSLYNAKEHIVSFKTGREPGSWLRGEMRANGSTMRQVNNTTEDYSLQDANRPDLVVNTGLNQKLQLIVTSERFGFTYSSLLNLFNLSAYTSSQFRNQIIYGGVSRLISKATITSLNKYVPTYVKINLVKIESTHDNVLTAWNKGVNPTLLAQNDGSMPIYHQQTAPSTANELGQYVFVDPKTPGLKGAEETKVALEFIESRTVKLYAGDRISLKHEHGCGSGIRVDKLIGADSDDSYNDDHPITFALMIEAWGEEVDAYQFLDPNSIIKGTCPNSLQFEFSKHIETARPSGTGSINVDPPGGLESLSIPIRTFTRSPLTTTSRRYFGDYDDLTSTNPDGYRIPVMSDAVEVDAGRIS